MKLKESEADIQKTILEYLEIKRTFHWRQNSGSMKVPNTNRFIRFGIVGAPDIFVVKNSKVYALEVKSAKGEQNDNQLKFEVDLTKAGGLYYVVRSLDEVKAIGL